MADVLKKVPVREQDPKVRATNFDEVCLGYNKDEAVEEAQRCLGCKKAKCMEGCPVQIHIPDFIGAVKEGDFAKAYSVISESSALPAICGRVCPQESQCEGRCISGMVLKLNAPTAYLSFGSTSVVASFTESAIICFIVSNGIIFLLFSKI